MKLRFAMACLASALFLPGLASAQEESTNRVGTNQAWNVFVEETPAKQCWAVSRPQETVNTRDGRVVAVRRGDILLFVFYQPDQNVSGQVSFTGGYPFASGSTVDLQIGDSRFELFSPGEDDPATAGDDREWAWPATPEDDAKIVAAMKRGAQAVLTARFSRGTVTKDTFSLFGFTAMVDDASGRCAS